MAPEEWGMSPLRERNYIHPEQKVPVKYNYWDYIDGFNKVLLYENANRKHSWFIEGESSNKKEFYDSLNKISEKYARKQKP